MGDSDTLVRPSGGPMPLTMNAPTTHEPASPMFCKLFIAIALVALGVAAPRAPRRPRRWPVAIIKAGQKTPVDIAGNDLRQGATIRKGTELRCWLVTMRGPRTRASRCAADLAPITSASASRRGRRSPSAS